MKILLAEDDEVLRASFVRQLVREGHEVEPYPNGGQLCAALSAGAQADMVWTDLAMPDGDGLSVIRAARSFLPSVQILVVSGHADGENVLGALRMGADHFLPKPIDQPDFHATLRRVEAVRAAYRDKVRVWHSFARVDLELHVPADFGVAAATAALLGKHARAFLDESERHGLQTAVHEILLNSIEHGCLEISHEEKVAALTEQRYSELVAERRANPALGERLVVARMTGDVEQGVVISFTDPGPGFDPNTLPDPSDPENLFLPSGRGIMMARLHLDELIYTDGGRTAILRARRRFSNDIADDEPTPPL